MSQRAPMSNKLTSIEDELERVRRPHDSSDDDEPQDTATSQVTAPWRLSDLERTLSRNSPILDSLLLHLPTSSIFQLYHTSNFLRRLLQSCPLAWKHLSFRLSVPSTQMTHANAPDDGVGSPRPSKNYALDQLLLRVVNPFSSNLKSLELDNTAVSGQILTSTVLLLRRETLEHLSVRGCKNVSLKYHLNPYLNVFGLQHEGAGEPGYAGREMSKMALKSLYTYRCRHHRRRPYLPSSLSRRDSDSEPTHELVTLCHKLGIWTDTAWCTTPGNRCLRRKNYVQMRVPNGTPEVWVVFDRLWRSRNWVGPPDGHINPKQRDGRSWEQDEYASDGEALGNNYKRRYEEGKATPTHLRSSHKEFVENITCDGCGDMILERCEQCSVIMHCAGCRKSFCASCAYDRPYAFRRIAGDASPDAVWWAPGYTVSPCLIAEPAPNPGPPNVVVQPPLLNLKWCCTQPIFSGGGGISFAQNVAREADRVRAAPLPRGQGWEDPEFTPGLAPPGSTSSATDLVPPTPGRLSDSARAHIVNWLLGPPGRTSIDCPRNLCGDCYNSESWKVHCKTCSKPLCMEHDLRGLKLRICGLKDLNLEKTAVREQAAKAALTRFTQREMPRSPIDGQVTSALQLNPGLLLLRPTSPSMTEEPTPTIATSSQSTSQATGESMPIPSGDTDTTLQVPLHHPLPSRFPPHFLPSPSSSIHGRPPSAGSVQTETSRGSSPSSMYHEPGGQGRRSTPTQGSPIWTGCFSFFCSPFRAHGDMRVRCPSQQNKYKECASCSTFVCLDCITTSPVVISAFGCKCTGCAGTFYCPNCQLKRVEGGDCKRIEEERREQEERERRERQLQEERKQREKSDFFVGMVSDFWGSVGGGADEDGGLREERENQDVEHEYVDAAGESSQIGPSHPSVPFPPSGVTGGSSTEESTVTDVLRRHVPRLRTLPDHQAEPTEPLIEFD